MFNFLEPSILLFIKGGILLFLVIYIIFAGAVVKQVRTMTETLEVGFEKQIIVLSYVHLAVALAIFIFSFVVL